MNTGIYEIVNTLNGKRYVGSAVSLVSRWCAHRNMLRRGIHHARHLQMSWAKHGEKVFEFRKLLICSKDKLVMYEQRAIDVLKPKYNVCPVAGSSLGVKHSAETRAKVSAASAGRRHTAESKEKISAAKRGKPGHKHSAEVRERMSAAHMGQKNTLGYRATAETKAKLSALMRGNRRALGVKHSPEVRASRSAAIKASWVDPEIRARHIAAKMTPESRDRNSASHLGKTVSVETRAKIVAGLKRYFNRVRSQS